MKWDSGSGRCADTESPPVRLSRLARMARSSMQLLEDLERWCGFVGVGLISRPLNRVIRSAWVLDSATRRSTQWPGHLTPRVSAGRPMHSKRPSSAGHQPDTAWNQGNLQWVLGDHHKLKHCCIFPSDHVDVPRCSVSANRRCALVGEMPFQHPSWVNRSLTGLLTSPYTTASCRRLPNFHCL